MVEIDLRGYCDTQSGIPDCSRSTMWLQEICAGTVTLKVEYLTVPEVPFGGHIELCGHGDTQSRIPNCSRSTMW